MNLFRLAALAVVLWAGVSGVGSAMDAAKTMRAHNAAAIEAAAH